MVIIRFGHDWDQTCMQMDEVVHTSSVCLGTLQRLSLRRVLLSHNSIVALG